MLADLAVIFGWQPSELKKLSNRQIRFWHKRAIARFELVAYKGII